ncbi:type I-C CRISPR-associated protein Cas5c [Geomicrobium sp. JCM 19038]|uniref:type I-C CRISPR-associated protein Cas5c n=1 Tax=Geomicrobium sp. JCM 19038 TaxID=1460635 RepID=UPI00045F45DB|nr:type I-C CRISPR-associated protein Cas5c [Geomicrobium sp. JCM 19038]GAK07087.1 CRISPR-associated protein, Cas5d family [Geomicrobium sp. JCM 19038]
METLAMKVWGDHALFTRPESKAERMSYPFITPAAARAILECIVWKPEMKWEVTKIKVLNPIKFLSVTRNERSNVLHPAKVNETIGEDKPLQRHSLFLKDVAYVIEGKIHVQPNVTHETNFNLQRKYESIFLQRLNKGQCFRRPYFGTRECSVQFSPVHESEVALPLTADFGTMLYDIKYPTYEKESAIPYFFNAKLMDGTLSIPNALYEEVHAPCM